MDELEQDLVARLLELSSEEFSNHGCNDLCVPDTPESRKLWRDSFVWYYAEEPAAGPPMTNDHICFVDWLLMKYLIARLRGEI